MTSYQKIRKNRQQFKHLTSLYVEEFDILLVLFTEEWQKFISQYTLEGMPRTYPYEPKNEERLVTTEDKLFFILFYKKIHCIQPALAAFFDIDMSMANKWIHILTPILENSLKKYSPKENIEEVDFTLHKEVIIDGTERPIQRDTYHQQEYYSGKKKHIRLKIY